MPAADSQIVVVHRGRVGVCGAGHPPEYVRCKQLERRAILSRETEQAVPFSGLCRRVPDDSQDDGPILRNESTGRTADEIAPISSAGRRAGAHSRARCCRRCQPIPARSMTGRLRRGTIVAFCKSVESFDLGCASGRAPSQRPAPSATARCWRKRRRRFWPRLLRRSTLYSANGWHGKVSI